MTKGMTVLEIVDGLGPICAVDEDTGCMVSVNGSYLNFFAPCGEGRWENTDCRSLSSENGLYSITAAEAIDKAEEYLKDVLNGSDEAEEA